MMHYTKLVRDAVGFARSNYKSLCQLAGCGLSNVYLRSIQLDALQCFVIF